MENLKKQISENNKCSAQDVVFDIKTIMQDFYFAQFTENGNELSVLFDDGQKFVISVRRA